MRTTRHGAKLASSIWRPASLEGEVHRGKSSVVAQLILEFRQLNYL
jgi:hypothetical protein